MKWLGLTSAALLIAFSAPACAEPRVVCTFVQEVGASEPLIREGQDCDKRISPASTFKVAISLMGFDSGVLSSPDEPELPFEKGYVGWRPEWRQTTTPKRWMRYSVVWFSQRITEQIGAERFAAYVDAFSYGNEDVSGDKGKTNGLTHAWLSSSLQISPAEQVAFLTHMVSGELPVSARAVEETKILMENRDRFAGWHVYGKTGSGLPFGGNGALLKEQPFGWYVGWAEKDNRRVVFARLTRFDERPKGGSPGGMTRDGLMAELFAKNGPLN
ncbi:MAG: class D beta-lactamase [Rhodobiaceae bacterium]|nr:class D beta-lactamase [Rhodobiaceae bacterium]MCC0048879.1 class D beta-lactamase [Rhodobiaceae bacterium]